MLRSQCQWSQWNEPYNTNNFIQPSQVRQKKQNFKVIHLSLKLKELKNWKKILEYECELMQFVDTVEFSVQSGLKSVSSVKP